MTIEIINIQDVTNEWGTRIFNGKLEATADNVQAYKKLRYGHNIYTYVNTAIIGGVFHSYYTQTSECIRGQHSITFLN